MSPVRDRLTLAYPPGIALAKTVARAFADPPEGCIHGFEARRPHDRCSGTGRSADHSSPEASSVRASGPSNGTQDAANCRPLSDLHSGLGTIDAAAARQKAILDTTPSSQSRTPRVLAELLLRIADGAETPGAIGMLRELRRVIRAEECIPALLTEDRQF